MMQTQTTLVTLYSHHLTDLGNATHYSMVAFNWLHCMANVVANNYLLMSIYFPCKSSCQCTALQCNSVHCYCALIGASNSNHQQCFASQMNNVGVCASIHRSRQALATFGCIGNWSFVEAFVAQNCFLGLLLFWLCASCMFVHLFWISFHFNQLKAHLNHSVTMWICRPHGPTLVVLHAWVLQVECPSRGGDKIGWQNGVK